MNLTIEEFIANAERDATTPLERELLARLIDMQTEHDYAISDIIEARSLIEKNNIDAAYDRLQGWDA